MTRFIDLYAAILFDICGTLMFGYDRYGPDVDYHHTYAQLGGNDLTPEHLARIINQLFLTIKTAETVPANYDPFPSLHQFALASDHLADLPKSELERLEMVFAIHECGSIPERLVETVRTLHATHPVGIISNIWSLKPVFEQELLRAGLGELLHPRIWSPDCGCIKPAERIFRCALAYFDLPPERILYVGDTFLRDIYGAKRLGLSAAWINPQGLPVPGNYGVQPDLVLEDASQLLNI